MARKQDSDDDDDESNYSTSEGEDGDDYSSSQGSSGSSICSDDQSFPEADSLFRHTNSIVRRRVMSPANSEDDTTNSPANNKKNNGPACRNRRPRRQRQQRGSFMDECFQYYNDQCPLICNRRVNTFLVLCIVLWFGVQLHDALKTTRRGEDPMRVVQVHSKNRRRDSGDALSPQKLADMRRPRPQKAGFWKEAAQKLDHWMTGGRPRKKRRRKGKMEALRPGCEMTEWQSLSFPTCNNVHELDLREALGLRKKGGSMANSKTGEYGYVGAGLWRNVWKVQGYEQTPFVLKMMKGEHEVDTRNLDRHRRDALTMERLTSSPNIVSIYDYCGNTVISEYMAQRLDDIVYDKEKHAAADKHAVATRHTPLGRLRLALHVARGVAALHEIPGGPIIHADIQAKQFMVDSKGIVKLNDFNRCRFMANSTSTGKPCPLRIPTAPGSYRSPEEYKSDELTEKLDVFSMANVLYAVLTGNKPWGSMWGKEVSKLVKAGTKPTIDEKYLKYGTTDAKLANLIVMAYELDPVSRPKASKLVKELERLVAAEEAKQASNK